jgi:hypothetical protein
VRPPWCGAAGLSELSSRWFSLPLVVALSARSAADWFPRLVSLRGCRDAGVRGAAPAPPPALRRLVESELAIAALVPVPAEEAGVRNAVVAGKLG